MNLLNWIIGYRPAFRRIKNNQIETIAKAIISDRADHDEIMEGFMRVFAAVVNTAPEGGRQKATLALEIIAAAANDAAENMDFEIATRARELLMGRVGKNAAVSCERKNA